MSVCLDKTHLRIKVIIRIDLYLPVKTRLSACMASGFLCIVIVRRVYRNFNPDTVLIAIGAHIEHFLRVAAGRALMPERLPAA